MWPKVQGDVINAAADRSDELHFLVWGGLVVQATQSAENRISGQARLRGDERNGRGVELRRTMETDECSAFVPLRLRHDLHDPSESRRVDSH